MSRLAPGCHRCVGVKARFVRPGRISYADLRSAGFFLLRVLLQQIASNIAGFGDFDMENNVNSTASSAAVPLVTAIALSSGRGRLDDVTAAGTGRLTSGSTWARRWPCCPIFNMSLQHPHHDYFDSALQTLEEETGLNAGFAVVGNLRMAQTDERMEGMLSAFMSSTRKTWAGRGAFTSF